MWTEEHFNRVGKIVLLVFNDGISRGSIDLYDAVELEQWQNFLNELNKQTPESSHQRIEQRGYGV